jgi:hypothetical protein
MNIFPISAAVSPIERSYGMAKIANFITRSFGSRKSHTPTLGKWLRPWKRMESNSNVDDDLLEDLGASPSDGDPAPEIRLVALKSLRRQEVEIVKVFDGIRKLNEIPDTPPDWKAMLTRCPEEGY